MKRMKLRGLTRNAAVVLGNVSITEVAEVSTKVRPGDLLRERGPRSRGD